MPKYNEVNNRPSSVNHKALVHNHYKAVNKCYTEDNMDNPKHPSVWHCCDHFRHLLWPNFDQTSWYNVVMTRVGLLTVVKYWPTIWTPWGAKKSPQESNFLSEHISEAHWPNDDTYQVLSTLDVKFEGVVF